ncbi:hypothetical protein NUM3379_32610 [Kineococcus sp. NUM-3379]
MQRSWTTPGPAASARRRLGAAVTLPCPRSTGGPGGGRRDPGRRRRPGLTREALGFVLVGAVTTGAYLGLLLVLEPLIGSYPANILSVLVTSVWNTAWNRSLSFGVHGRRDVGRHQLQGLFTCLLSMALTSGCIALAEGSGMDPWLRSAVLVAANAGAGILHFLLLKVWVFSR